MTLVAVLYAEHTPLVITDSLISQEAAEVKGVTTPLLPQDDMRSGENYAPVGLARKFWVLPDGSIFFYSGIGGSARQLFDEISKYCSAESQYNQELHTHASDYLKRISNPFSFLVAVPGEKGVALFTHRVTPEEFSDYGVVVLLGSGQDAAKSAMVRYPLAAPSDENARLLNAYNLAAHLTLDYRDSKKQGSEMTASSCGGYFEVIEPSLYSRKSSSLIRGTAHLFFQVTKEEICLDDFVASRQDDKETRIISAFDLGIQLEGPDFYLDDSLVQEFVLSDDRHCSGLGKQLKGRVPFSHIRGVILYASMIPECGKEEHRMQTLTVLVGPNFPAATLIASDEHTNTIHVSLFCDEGDPVKRLADRLRTQARRHCDC